MVVKTIWLEQIDDVELVWFTSSCVTDSEIEPLSLPFDKKVWSQDQIILIVIDLYSSPKVSTFKP